MTGTKLDPRLIDRGTPPERFARGCHCLGLAEPFRDGKPHAIAHGDVAGSGCADRMGRGSLLEVT